MAINQWRADPVPLNMRDRATFRSTLHRLTGTVAPAARVSVRNHRGTGVGEAAGANVQAIWDKAIKATNDETADEPEAELDKLRDGKIWRMQEK